MSDARVVITAEDQASAQLEKVKAAAHDLGAGLGSVANIAAQAAASFATLATGAAVFAVREADSFNDLSQKLGIGVEQLASYKLAAEQSGTSIESIGRGIRSLSGAMLAHGAEFKKVGIETQDADKAFKQLADVFTAMPDGMDKAALAVKLFGKEGMNLIPMLNLGSKGLEDAAEKSRLYAANMAILAPQADALNYKLAELGIAGQALGANLASKVVPGLTNIATAMAVAAQEGSLLQVALVGLGGAMDAIIKPFRGIGKGIIAELNEGMAGIEDWLANKTWGKVAENHKKQADQYRAAAQANWRDIAAEAERDAPTVAPPVDPTLDEKTKQKIKKQAEELRKIFEHSVKARPVKAELSFEAKDFAQANAAFFKAMNDASEASAFGEMGLSKLQQAYEHLFSSPAFRNLPDATRDWYQQEYNAARAAEQLTQAMKDQAAWEKDLEAARVASAAAAANDAESLLQRAKAAEEENAGIGKTAEQLAALVAARYDEQIAVKRAALDLVKNIEGREGEAYAIEQQIAALERLKNAEIARPRLQAQAQAWDKFADDIERSLTDALMRGFEAGNSFGENFVKTLQNTLKTAALKVVVQAIVDPIMGGVRGMLGVGAGAAGSGASLLSAGSGLWSAWSGGTTAALGGLVGGEFGAGMAGAYLAPGLTGPTTAGAAGAMGLGSTFGTALPWVGGALAVGSLLGLFGDDDGPATRTGTVNQSGTGGDNYRYTSAINTFSPWASNQWFSADMAPAQESFAKTLVAIDNKIADAISGAQLDAVRTALAADAPTAIAFGTEGTPVEQSGAFGTIMTERYTIVLNSLMAGLGDLAAQGGITEAEVLGLVAGLDAVKASLAQINPALADGLPSALVTALGGLESMQSALSAFDTATTSDAERMTRQAGAVNQVFADLGMDAPKTVSALRDIVAAQDLTTESGRRTFAALVRVAPAFAEVTKAAEKSAADAAKAWAGFDAAGLGKLILDTAFNPSAGQSAAQAFSVALEESVRNSLINSTVGSIAESIYQAVIIPLVAGQAVSEASIQSVVATSQAAINALATTLESLDLSAIVAAVGGLDFSAIASSAQAPAASPAVSAGGGAEPIVSDIEAIFEAIRDGIAETDRAIARLGMTSYEAALADIADQAAQWRRQLLDTPELAGLAQRKAAWEQALAMREEGGVTAAEAPAVEAYRRAIAALDEQIAAATGSVDQWADAQRRLLDAQNALAAGELTGDLQKQIDRIGLSGLDLALADIADQAEDYRRRLLDLGQATTENIAQVDRWEEAMSANAVAEEWRATADSIAATMDRLRGKIAGDPRQQYAAAEAQFALATAAARAGDKAAADRLPELASSLVELGGGLSRTGIEQALLAARTAASLQTTLDALSAMTAMGAPADPRPETGGYDPRLGPDGQPIAPRISGASDSVISLDVMRETLRSGDMMAELRALREEVRRLREDNSAENRAVAGSNARIAKILTDVCPEGDAITTRAAA